MPKRRISTARQRQAAQRNLIKAREAKARKAAGRIPVGKNGLLVHHTQDKSAAKILAEQKFKAPSWRTGSLRGAVYFTPASSRTDFYTKAFGKDAVSVKVSRKFLQPDIHNTEHRDYGAVFVNEKILAGVKIRKYTSPARLRKVRVNA